MIMYLLYSYSEVAFFKPVSDFTMLFFTYALFNNYYQTDNKEEIREYVQEPSINFAIRKIIAALSSMV